MITRTFKLCLNAGTGSAPYINVSQYDEGETWLFELYSETGERYIPTTGAIVGVKSDGHGIANTGTVDSEGRVVIAETQQMTASAGRAIYELSIDGLTHGTANFIVAVERKPTDDAVMSDSDLSLIQEAIDSAEVIVEVIGDGDPSEVIGEHVDAWLDNHPEATTTVQDGAITAPKINNSLWDKLLVSEEASGNPASFEDGADDVPVSSLKVNLEPIQLGSGDPSPSNVRPIIASNGKNVINADGMVNDNFVKSGNDYIFTQNGNGASARSTGYAPFSAVINEPYTFSFIIDNTGGMTNTFAVRVDYADETNEVIYSATISSGYKTATFTPTKETTQIWMYSSSSTANVGKSITIKNIQLERGSATPFQPYQGIMVEQAGKNLIDESGLPKTVSGANYIPFSLPSWAYERGRIEDVTLSLKGSLGEGKTRFALYIDDTVHNNALYVDNSQYLTTANNFTLKGKITIGSSVTDSTKPLTIKVYAQPYDGSITSTISGLMLAFGDTEYEPYTGTSYPYSLGQNVYGGTVDLATGVLTVTHGIDLIDGNHAMSTNGSDGATSRFILTPNPVKANGLGGFISDKFNIGTGIYVGKMVGRANSGNIEFYLPVDVPQTVADGKAWFAENPTTICYPLATPTTIQLTPTQVKTLLGYNNISSTGTVEVIYHADTKLYVDKMTNVDNAIIAPTEEGFTATRNYTVNDLVIVADTLYKVTANIATGSAITPNSNVQQTTLSALIKALS